MRVRKKAWARPELMACPYFVTDPQAQKGRWEERFGQKRPLHLDLGCGKCVFLAPMAAAHRDVNYVGIDLSYDILGVGRRNIAAAFGEEQPDNVAQMCIRDSSWPSTPRPCTRHPGPHPHRGCPDRRAGPAAPPGCRGSAPPWPGPPGRRGQSGRRPPRS